MEKIFHRSNKMLLCGKLTRANREHDVPETRRFRSFCWNCRFSIGTSPRSSTRLPFPYFGRKESYLWDLTKFKLKSCRLGWNVCGMAMLTCLLDFIYFHFGQMRHLRLKILSTLVFFSFSFFLVYFKKVDCGWKIKFNTRYFSDLNVFNCWTRCTVNWLNFEAWKHLTQFAIFFVFDLDKPTSREIKRIWFFLCSFRLARSWRYTTLLCVHMLNLKFKKSLDFANFKFY